MLRRLMTLTTLVATVMVGSQPALAIAPSVHRYETSPDGRFVTETIEFQSPASVTLTFNYCNPLSCSGSDDPLRDCHAGFYIPNAGGEFPRTLSLSPLPGSTGTKLFLKTSSPAGVPSHYGYWEIGGTNPTGDFDTGIGIGAILANPPTTRADGGIDLSFHSPLPPAVRSAFKPGGTCGVTEEVANQFRNQSVDNYYTTRTKVAVVWKLAKPGSLVNLQRTIRVDSTDQTTGGQYGQARPTVVPLNTLRSTVIASTPSDRAKGFSSQDIVSILTKDGSTLARETDLRVITSRLSQGESALVFLTTTDPTTKARSVGATVVSSYEEKKDRFTVVDPATGKSAVVSYADFMATNPNFTFVTKAAQ